VTDRTRIKNRYGSARRVIAAAVALAALALLSACSTNQPSPRATMERIDSELERGVRERAPARPAALDQALLAPPPAQPAPSAPLPKAPEHRFDLVVSGAPAQQVFSAIVSGTRYSMLVHPEVSGSLTINLKDVSVREALDTIRELYGYEYKIQGSRIFIQPLALQTRVFQINYLFGQRQGKSDVRVTSGSISTVSQNNTVAGASSVPGSGSSQQTVVQESSHVTTESKHDFWNEVTLALKALVGTDGGRSVVVSPQTGVIVARAFPAELRNVESYLRATKLVIERQVMLEAKIVEVSLRDGYQAGINWAAFRNGNSRLSAGTISPGSVLQRQGALGTGAANIDFADRSFDDPSLSALPGSDLVAATRNLGGLFGLAFQTSNFAAILQFLETQGGVHVLSSPRIATINNQKAVLKVGTDDFFVTNISTTTTTTTAGTTATPTITVQPFFSGIALDVTPQIDEDGNIILHVHPSVSSVSEKTKVINLGSLGNFTLPLASSTVNESDSVVRVQDGNIVAIGGLMRQQQTADRSQVPGVGDVPVVGELFRQTSRGYSKSELVILLKPTVIQGDRGWQQDLAEVQERLQNFDPRAVEPATR
jgi:MSHA biogenesis protein MshL